MFPVGVSIPPIALTPARPKGLYWPAFDQTISDEERTQRFGPWVSSYYTQIDDNSALTLEKLGARSPVQDLPEEVFQSLNIESWKKVPSLDRFDPDELAALSSPKSTARYFVTLGKLDRSVHEDTLRSALGLGVPSTPNPVESTDIVWPKCKLLLVWCDMTLVDCALASASVVQILRNEGAGVKRKVEVERLSGSNHFVCWSTR